MINKYDIFLDSKFSLSDKIWLKPKKHIQEIATNFQQTYPISYPLALLLAQKRIDINKIDTFLNPKIKHIMPDPSSLLDLDKATRIIIETIKYKKKNCHFCRL